MKEKGELSKKKVVLMTIVVVAISALLVGAGTLAYFSASQYVGPNEFTTGSIIFSINGAEDHWAGNFNASLSDLKPGMTRWGNVTVVNTGTNPADMWMRINNITNTSFGTNPAKQSDPLFGQLNISSVIHYGVYNWSTGSLYPSDPVFPAAYVAPGTYTVTDGMYGVTGTGAKEQWIYLGNIPAGQQFFVNESFMMDPSVTNWAQLMNMTFTVDFYAQQREGDTLPTAISPELAGHTR